MSEPGRYDPLVAILCTYRLSRMVGPLRGWGLFSAQECAVRIEPGQPGAGLRVRREGREVGSPFVSAVWTDASWAGLPPGVPVRNTTLALGNGAIAATVEHVLSALVGLGVWDATVVLDGIEVPIADGSAMPFVELLQPALEPAASPREPIVLARRVEVRDDRTGATVVGEPSEDAVYEYELVDARAGLKQRAEWRVGDHAAYARDIAPARTYSTLADARAAQSLGLFRHLTPRDMLVLDEHGTPVENALRFADEPAKHKLLDLIGDLALLGRPLLGRVTASRSGHALTHAFCRAVAGTG